MCAYWTGVLKGSSKNKRKQHNRLQVKGNIFEEIRF